MPVSTKSSVARRSALAVSLVLGAAMTSIVPLPARRATRVSPVIALRSR
jgi:hypothetical protein